VVVQMGHFDSVSKMKVSYDGKYVITLAEDNYLKIWDLKIGKELKSILTIVDSVEDVLFFPTNNNYLISFKSGKILCWGLFDKIPYDTLNGHNGKIKSINFSKNSEFLISAGEDRTIRIWNLKNRVNKVYNSNDIINFAMFNYDESEIYAINVNNDLLFMNKSNGLIKESIHLDSNKINEYYILFDSDNTLVIVGSYSSNYYFFYFDKMEHKITKIVKKIFDEILNDGIHAINIKKDSAYVYNILTNESYCKFYIEPKNNDEWWGKPENFLLIPNTKQIFIARYTLVTDFIPRFQFWIYNYSNGKIINKIEVINTIINKIIISKDEKYFFIHTGDNKSQLWNIIESKLKNSTFLDPGIYYNKNLESNYFMQPDYGSYELQYYNKINFIKDISFNVNSTYELDSFCIFPLQFLKDQTLVLCFISKYGYFDGNNNLYLFDYKNKILRNLNYCQENDSFPLLVEQKENNLIICYKNKFVIIEIKSGIITLECSFEHEVLNAIANDDKNQIYVGLKDKSCKKIDLEDYTISDLFIENNIVSPIYYNSNNNTLIYFTCKDFNDFVIDIRIRDLNENRLINSMYINDIIYHFCYLSKSNLLFTSGRYDGYIKMWNINKGDLLLKLLTIYKGDYLSITPDNYYLCSKGGINAIAFVIGNEVYPPEQFDLQYNRPDIVLERIGLADPEIIKAYREAYYKRLRKMKFDTLQFRQDFHLPELKIVNKDFLWGKELSDKNIKLQIDAKDTAYTLDRINVFVNEVPVFGTNGIDLRNRNTHTFTENIPLELSDENNKIQVSVLNSAGVESIKDFFDVTYKPQKKYIPKTYFIGIGVSNYKDRNFNLNYASKDIYNLDSLYKIHDSKNLVSITLYDEQVTRENILNIRETLLKTNINDLVIVSLSGHGILDKNYNFYYATWNMKFDEPSKYGLIYDDLDKLLDSIPARKKVLFIDACNSGEVDIDLKKSDTLIAQNKKEGKEGDIPDIIDSLQKNSVLGLKNSFEIMQEIFINLTRGNGAVVISAARGYQSAFEKESFGNTGGNGAFTACIIEALTEKKSELSDKNGHITISKLKDYVIKRVEEITKGRQKPTTRTENLEYDFVVW
jgi:WD40 repeat protein